MQPTDPNQVGNTDPQATVPSQPATQPFMAQATSAASNMTTTAKSGSKKIVIIVVIAVVAALGIGGGTYMLTKKGSTKSSSSLVGQDVTDKKSGSVGDTISAANFELGVLSIDKKAQLDEYTKAAAGKTFIIASVSFKNGTSDVVNVSPTDFTMTTSDKKVVTGADYYGSSNNLPTDGIAPGGTAKGVVVFEVDPALVSSIDYSYSLFPKDTAKDVHHFEFNYKLK